MKPHVLVVDDSMIVRMDLRGALNAAGFEVTVCETKRTADEILDRHAFSAIVLDVMLPDGDGVEILKRLRANARHAQTPVIMLSAEVEVRDRVRGLNMGADEYVGKPYNIAYFVSRIRELSRTPRNDGMLLVSNIGCRRVLVADDSPTFLEYLMQMLRGDGHDVVLAHTGKEALEMLGAQTFDCVVLDYNMPEVDGLETLRRIRQTPGRASTPIIMMTENRAIWLEREALDAGADAFLHKSATPEVVHARIRNLLRGRHAAQWSGAKRPLPPDSVRNGGDANPHAQQSKSHRKAAPGHNALFLEAAAAMGLNHQLARDTLTRTLAQLNIDPQTMDQADLSRAIPAIRDALRVFFSTEELLPRIEALTSITTRNRGKAT